MEKTNFEDSFTKYLNIFTNSINIINEYMDILKESDNDQIDIEEVINVFRSCDDEGKITLYKDLLKQRSYLQKYASFLKKLTGLRDFK